MSIYSNAEKDKTYSLDKLWDDLSSERKILKELHDENEHQGLKAMYNQVSQRYQ